MFNVTANAEFTHTVKVQVPVDGGHEEQTFKARFRVVAADDAAALNFLKPEDVKKHLLSILVSMDDLEGPDKKPLQYNDSVRDQMLAKPHVRIALLRTYRDAFAKERAGN